MIFFVAIVAYVLVLIANNFSAFSAASQEAALQTKAIQVSELLVRSGGAWSGSTPLSIGLSSGWPEINSTKVAFLDAYCSVDYVGLLGRLDAEQNKVRIEARRKSYLSPNLSCGFDAGFACENNETVLIQPAIQQGVDFVTGRFDIGIFSNESDILQYPTANSVGTPLSAGTIQFWVKYQDSSQLEDGIYTLFSAQLSNGNITGIAYIKENGLPRDNMLNFTFNSTSLLVPFVLGSGNHHITFVFDALEPDINEMYRVYIDGKRRSPDAFLSAVTQPYPVSITPSVYIGSVSSGRAANATIDDFRIYDSARSEAQIEQDRGNQAGRLLECGLPVPSGISTANAQRIALVNETVDVDSQPVSIVEPVVLNVWIWR
ncbi:MAG: LamG domain-containing protein [Candidatus Aenigmarchaeota archaeon]|nr:LamG domain-containing protein [Candidatus Aenigmarchaeota archaeon]